MKLVIVAHRDPVTYVPSWIWWAWLTEGEPIRSMKTGKPMPNHRSIWVGSNYPSWDAALKAGMIAQRTAATTWKRGDT